jgi:hypothetical protein
VTSLIDRYELQNDVAAGFSVEHPDLTALHFLPAPACGLAETLAASNANMHVVINTILEQW